MNRAIVTSLQQIGEQNIEKINSIQPITVTDPFIHYVETVQKNNNYKEREKIKICSWTGLRAALDNGCKEHLKVENSDIIAIQEAKSPTRKLPPEAEMEGQYRYALDSKTPGYCGAILYTKRTPIKVT